MPGATLEDVAVEIGCPRKLAKGFRVDLKHGERRAGQRAVGEAQVDLAEVATLRRLRCDPGCGGGIGTDAKIERGNDQLAARREQRAHALDEPREAGETTDLVEAVADREHGVERAALEGEEVRRAGIADAAPAHDPGGGGIDVDGGHRMAALLQKHGVDPRASADVEDAASAKVQRRRLERVHLGAQPEGGGNVVALAVLLADQHRIGDAALVVEQGRAVRGIGSNPWFNPLVVEVSGREAPERRCSRAAEGRASEGRGAATGS